MSLTCLPILTPIMQLDEGGDHRTTPRYNPGPLTLPSVTTPTPATMRAAALEPIITLLQPPAAAAAAASPHTRSCVEEEEESPSPDKPVSSARCD